MLKKQSGSHRKPRRSLKPRRFNMSSKDSRHISAVTTERQTSGPAGFIYALALWLLIASFALAKESGVIDDPSGYVNVLADKQPDAAIIANVKTGERVSFECDEGDKWCKVKLRSGNPVGCISVAFGSSSAHRERSGRLNDDAV